MTTYATYGYKKDPLDKNHYIIDEEIAMLFFYTCCVFCFECLPKQSGS